MVTDADNLLDFPKILYVIGEQMKNLKFKVSVLVLREENKWVAQCMEYDISAQADSLAGVKYAFAKAFVSQVAVNLHFKKKPLQDVPKTPSFYKKFFKDAERLANPALPKPVIGETRITAQASDMRIAA